MTKIDAWMKENATSLCKQACNDEHSLAINKYMTLHGVNVEFDNIEKDLAQYIKDNEIRYTEFVDIPRNLHSISKSRIEHFDKTINQIQKRIQHLSTISAQSWQTFESVYDEQAPEKTGFYTHQECIFVGKILSISLCRNHQGFTLSTQFTFNIANELYNSQNSNKKSKRGDKYITEKSIVEKVIDAYNRRESSQKRLIKMRSIRTALFSIYLDKVVFNRNNLDFDRDIIKLVRIRAGDYVFIAHKCQFDRFSRDYAIIEMNESGCPKIIEA